MRPGDDTQMGGSDRAFPATQWANVQAAATQDFARRQTALAALAERYWKPVYAFLRQSGLSNDSAKDLTQGFFEKVILGRNLIEKADPRKGRFRTYLLSALKNFRMDVLRGELSGRHRPEGGPVVSLGAFEEPPQVAAQQASPDDAYSCAWARQLLEEVLRAVEEGYRRGGAAAHWEVFRLTVVEPALHGAGRPSLGELCSQLRIADEARAANMTVTVKRRFAAVLRKRVSDYAESEADVDTEIRELMNILNRGRHEA